MNNKNYHKTSHGDYEEICIGILSDDEINKNIAILDAKLEVNQEKIDEEKKLKEKYTPHLDKIDYLVSVCSGVVTGIIDAFIKKKETN